MTWYRVYFRKPKSASWGTDHPQLLVEGEAERDRIMARRSPKALHWEVAKIHRCSVCEVSGPWSDEWIWFGSLRDIDDGKDVLKFCSKACRDTLEDAKREEERRPWRESVRFHRNEAEADISGRWQALREASEAANHRKVPMPEWSGPGSCRWCSKPTVYESGKKVGQPAPGRIWHNACYYQYQLHTVGAVQHDFLFHRDGPRCQICGAGGYAPGPVTLDRPAGMTWERWLKLLNDATTPGLYCLLKPSIGFEVDHITPLWRAIDYSLAVRRRLYGPENLWLLCVDCHKAKTAIEAAERAERWRTPS